MYVNEQWCKNYTLREAVCLGDIELLSMSFRPFYLPREFGQIFVTLVYIHPEADKDVATGLIHDTVAKQENIAPDAPKLILGDFNNCALKQTLPQYHPYVNCPTRKEKTIDLCYGNIKGYGH